MTTIYKVTHTNDRTGNLFTTRDFAFNYACSIMRHFGGEWKSIHPSRENIECAFVSEHVFHHACAIETMSVRIEKVVLNQTPAPRLKVIESYTDYEGKCVYKLGRNDTERA